MVRLDNFSLASIIPDSIIRDKNIQAIIQAVDPELHKIYDEISRLEIYSRLDELPEDILDILAWQWHVDFYELAKNLDAKRAMIKGSIEWHRHKGTSYAIIKALDMIGVEAKFIPWYKEGAEPYTFAIEAKLNNDFWERVDWTKPTQTIRRAIIESKAARSYMSRIYVYFEQALTRNVCVKQVIPQGIFRRVKTSRFSERRIIHRVQASNLSKIAIIDKLGVKAPESSQIRQNLTLNNKSSMGNFYKIIPQSRNINVTNQINFAKNSAIAIIKEV